MDDKRFDLLTRAFASNANRRSLIKGLLGLGGAAAVGTAVNESVDAARRPTPTPTPHSCPGVQHWDGTKCVCPPNLTQCVPGGPTCCNDQVPVAPGYSECCDNACCQYPDQCVSEEQCCPRLPDSACVDAQGRCCTTLCEDTPGGVECCPTSDFCPGGSESADLCCEGNSVCCGANTNGNACTDLSDDNNNCGACGNVCGGCSSCQQGVCQPDDDRCEGTLICCPSGNTFTCEVGPNCGCDNDGDCDYLDNASTCTSGQCQVVGEVGTCVAVPAANTVICHPAGSGANAICDPAVLCTGQTQTCPGPDYAQPGTDCGACMECNETGVCTEQCGVEEDCCPGTDKCVPDGATCCTADTQCTGDCQTCNEELGYCVSDCTDTETCCTEGQGAECCSTAAGSACCDGVGCVDTNTDDFNCGACGHVCPGCSTCQNGLCTATDSQCDVEGDVCCKKGDTYVCEEGPFCGCDDNEDCADLDNAATCQVGVCDHTGPVSICVTAPAPDTTVCHAAGASAICDPAVICNGEDQSCPGPDYAQPGTDCGECMTCNATGICGAKCGVEEDCCPGTDKCVPDGATCCTADIQCTDDCEYCDEDAGYCKPLCPAEKPNCCPGTVDICVTGDQCCPHGDCGTCGHCLDGTCAGDLTVDCGSACAVCSQVLIGGGESIYNCVDCPTGSTCCGDDLSECYDLQNDSKNCGQCGHICEGCSTCQQGVCVATNSVCPQTPTAQICCPGGGTFTCEEGPNCGCDGPEDCSPCERCDAGICKPICTDSQECCPNLGTHGQCVSKQEGIGCCTSIDCTNTGDDDCLVGTCSAEGVCGYAPDNALCKDEDPCTDGICSAEGDCSYSFDCTNNSTLCCPGCLACNDVTLQCVESDALCNATGVDRCLDGACNADGSCTYTPDNDLCGPDCGICDAAGVCTDNQEACGACQTCIDGACDDDCTGDETCCPGSTDFCVDKDAGGCCDNTDCTGNCQICDGATHACIADPECCSPTCGDCEQCENGECVGCSAPTPFCRTADETCVQCLTAGDCPSTGAGDQCWDCVSNNCQLVQSCPQGRPCCQGQCTAGDSDSGACPFCVSSSDCCLGCCHYAPNWGSCTGDQRDGDAGHCHIEDSSFLSGYPCACRTTAECSSGRICCFDVESGSGFNNPPSGLGIGVCVPAEDCDDGTCRADFAACNSNSQCCSGVCNNPEDTPNCGGRNNISGSFCLGQEGSECENNVCCVSGDCDNNDECTAPGLMRTSAEDCVPGTCKDLGWGCGQTDDGCGGKLDCGTCEEGITCDEKTHQCLVQCTPVTCQAGQCGTIDDGCGATLDCGACSDGSTCDEATHQCVANCTPVTCADLGAVCGAPADGCGKELDCGACQDGYYCDETYQCVASCIPMSCGELGAQCGTPDDGCGTTLDCGQCTGYPNSYCTENSLCDCAPLDCSTVGTCGVGLDNGCGSPIDCPCEQPVNCVDDQEKCTLDVDVCCNPEMVCRSTNRRNVYRCQPVQ